MDIFRIIISYMYQYFRTNGCVFCTKIFFFMNTIHICFKTNNTTVVSYNNAKGGMHSKQLDDFSIQNWSWCIKREIFISAQYLPGCENIYADLLSRQFADSKD